MSRAELGIRINAGQLNCPVIIEDYIVEKVGIEHQKVWKSISDGVIYAQWIGVHGNDNVIAGQVLSADRATVRLRYNPKINTKCRLIKDNDYKNPYKIVSVDDVRYNHQWMEIKVERQEKS